MPVNLKRVYLKPSPDDGARVLVDRLWPRGISKAKAKLDAWLKEIAPSNELRKWFGHDPARWETFQRRYHAELDAQPDQVRAIEDLVRSGPITLLFAAKDTEHNNAVALRNYLQRRS